MTLTGEVHEIDWVLTYAPGWHSVLTGLRDALAALPVEVRVAQVKEKFGDLRFYYDLVGDDVPDKLGARVEQLVTEAGERTYRVCFLCAAPATHVGVGYWVRYFCDAHGTVDVRRRPP